jgi:hypothetical protein
MAEQFIIRVQIDDERFNAAPQANRVPANSNAGVPLVAAGSVALSVSSQQQSSREYTRLTNLLNIGPLSSGDYRESSEKLNKLLGGRERFFMLSEEQKRKNLAKFSKILEPKEITPQEQIQEKPEKLISPRRTASLALATSLRVVQGFVSHAQHRSGDRYFNQQLQSSMSMAATIGGLAITAAFNPVLAAVAAGGIVLNTTVDMFATAANYDYDRKMDTAMIHNVKEVSGNVSYGRRGGTR